MQGTIATEINNQTGGAVLYGSAEITAQANMPDTEIALYFDTITSHSIQINDNITDNWLEDSNVVNDCIALSPLTVTLSGLSSEIVYEPGIKNKFLKKVYDAINNKLGPINAIFPQVDNVTQTAINLINVIDDNIEHYKKIYENYKNTEAKQKRLKEIYNNLMTLRASRTALTIETPYTDKPLEHMYIQSLTLTQDNQNYITDISITLKQLNFSDVQTTEADKNVLAELNALSRAQVENQGKVQGISKDSTAYKIFTPNQSYINLSDF